jgi:hypothetical protein
MTPMRQRHGFSVERARARLGTVVGWSLGAHFVLCLAGVLFSLLFIVEVWLILGAERAVEGLPALAYLLVPAFLLHTVVIGYVGRSLRRGTARSWVLPAYLVGSVVAFVAAALFFAGPAHDVALWFGSHGRFGCYIIDEHGRSPHLFDDRTAAWWLMVPPPLVVTLSDRLRAHLPLSGRSPFELRNRRS